MRITEAKWQELHVINLNVSHCSSILKFVRLSYKNHLYKSSNVFFKYDMFLSLCMLRTMQFDLVPTTGVVYI